MFFLITNEISWCRSLLHGASVMWFIGFSNIGFAAINQVVLVRVLPYSSYTRIIVESNNFIKYKKFIISNPERLVVDLEEVKLNSVLKSISMQISRKDLYIKSARVGQFNKHTARIVFELKQKIKFQIFALAPISGFKERLIIDIFKLNSINLTDPILTLLEEYNKKNNFFSSNRYLLHSYAQNWKNFSFGKTKIKRHSNNKNIIIMLDPGHGGEDSGAVGKFLTSEKDVVLQIACRLKSLIDKENNMLAYMTRNKDVFIPLNLRVAKAQKYRADIFVSIHADAFTSRQPSGSSVFALSTKGATSTAAKYLADTQNSFDLIGGLSKSGDHYLDNTILDMVQSLTIHDSLKFGTAVLGKLSKVNKLHKNHVEQASFAVLKAPDIPSILVETGFISNIEEEQKLKTSKFQQQIAESILAGIKAYFSDKTILARKLNY